MNLQKFTQKSLEAIQNAQSNAVEYGNPQLDQQHLLLALLQQEDGLIPGLLQKMNINVNGLTQAVENEVKRLPRVSGGETRVAVDLEKALTAAEKLAENMTDEYVSVEHIFMAMVNAPNAALKELFRQYNVDRDGFMKNSGNRPWQHQSDERSPVSNRPRFEEIRHRPGGKGKKQKA